MPDFTRRRLFKTLFCSSVAMSLNLRSSAEEESAAAGLDFLALGDFGTGDRHQKKVASHMARYLRDLGRPSHGMLMLGDNFYGNLRGGLKSSRWRSDFSQIYPATDFPAPCWAILSNHDYHDSGAGGEEVQLDYAASLGRKTRWTMPGRHYRVDFPAKNPQVTFLMIDTNWESINRRVHGGRVPCWISAGEKSTQMAWLEARLASKRAPITIVVGHHPIYSDGVHGDTPELVNELGPMLEKAGVHLYLCGHDHDLQHLELENLRTSFVISGGGGAPIHQIARNRQGAVGKAVHGFSHLAILGNRLHVRHIDSNGKLVHAFSKGADHSWKVES